MIPTGASGAGVAPKPAPKKEPALSVSTRRWESLRICAPFCGGDPQCATHCPFEALSYAEIKPDMKYHGLSPEKIAVQLAQIWYGTADIGGSK
jgi:hypothetical protein